MKTRAIAWYTVVWTIVGAGCGEPARDEAQESALPAEEIAGDARQFASNARDALLEIQKDIAEIDAQYADIQGRAAETWEASQDQLIQVQQEAQTVVERMQGATDAEARTLRVAAGDAVEALTHQVERARLDAAQDARQFVATSQATLGEIGEDLRSLTTQTATLRGTVRETTMDEIDDLSSTAHELMEHLDTLAEAPPEQIASARRGVTEEIASLSASVRRQWLELADAMAAE